jgi:hypothetical protein
MKLTSLFCVISFICISASTGASAKPKAPTLSPAECKLLGQTTIIYDYATDSWQCCDFSNPRDYICGKTSAPKRRSVVSGDQILDDATRMEAIRRDRQ